MDSFLQKLSSRHCRGIVLASIVAGLLVIFWPDIRQAFQHGSPLKLTSLDFHAPVPQPELRLVGLRSSPLGLIALRPDSKLSLSIPREPGTRALLDIYRHPQAPIEPALALEVGGQRKPLPFPANSRAPFDITTRLKGASTFTLHINFRFGKSQQFPVPVLDKLVIIEQPPIFPLPLFLYTTGIFAAFALLIGTQISSESEAAVAFPFAVLGWTIVHTAMPEIFRSFIPTIFFLSFGVLLLTWTKLGLIAERKWQIEWIAAGMILLLGLSARWHQLETLQSRSLDPDPETYLELANRSHFFMDTSFREPLYILAVKAGTALFGRTPQGVRLTTCLLAAAAILIAWAVGRDVFSPVTGLLAALLLALHRNFVYINLRGYRLELYTLLLLLFFWFCFGKKGWSSRRRAVALGMVAALVCLTRLNAYSAVLLMALAMTKARKWPKRELLPILGIPILALTPSFIYWTHEFGDPMAAVNTHLRYYRNIEFVHNPSIPKSDDPYRGPTTNGIDYFLTRWHSPKQTAINVFAGLEAIFLGDYGWQYLYQGSGLLMVLSLAGLAYWFNRHHWPFLLWVFLLSAPVAFFQRISLDFRLILHVLPYLAYAAGDFLEKIFEFWKREK